MAQFTIDVLGKGGGVYASDEPFELDPAMMDTVFGKYKVGSILNTSNNRARTIEVWENTVKALQEKALKEIGIPVIYGIDAIHGTTYTAGATFFPQQIGMAATLKHYMGYGVPYSGKDRTPAIITESDLLAINAGIDMVMEPYNLKFCDELVALVKSGEVKQERIDDAVRRVLRLKFRLELFDRPSWSRFDYPDFGSPAHEAAAKSAADESITLQKNEDNILPLKKGVRLLVIGLNANSMRTLNGGSYSWQGEKVAEFAQQYNTIFEALQKKFCSRRYHYRYCRRKKYRYDGWKRNRDAFHKRFGCIYYSRCASFKSIPENKSPTRRTENGYPESGGQRFGFCRC